MEGPPLGPSGEDITWPDQVAPRGRKASSTRKIKPQTSNDSYTHALLGGVEGEVTSLSGSPVRLQENTDLLSVCGLTGTPQRVSLLGPRGKECSFGVHSAYVEGVRLPALPQAEAESFVCVINALV